MAGSVYVTIYAEISLGLHHHKYVGNSDDVIVTSVPADELTSFPLQIKYEDGLVGR
jgi:hypothetical protein